MPSSKIEAHVQYDDWKGSVAADDADTAAIASWLRSAGKIDDGDMVVAVEMSVGENHGQHRDPVYVEVYVESMAGQRGKIRRLTLELPIVDFLAMFKRLSISISRHGSLAGADVEFEEVTK